MKGHPLVHETVRRHAARDPDAPAIHDDGHVLSYGGLDRAASAFAACLVADGLSAGAVVAVDAKRQAGTFVAMLAIWRAGGVYLPIDPALPQGRKHAMLDDARPWRHLPADETRDLATGPASPDPRLRAVQGDDLAYILYTSGSTGRPKGVMVDHAALAHRAHVQRLQFDIRPGERITQYSSLSWDASLFEILLAFGAGATLSIIPDRLRYSGPALVRHLAETRAHVAFFPPSVLAAMPVEALPDLRMVMLGGDAFPGSLVSRWGGVRRFVNLYGPTETAVWVSTDDCLPDKDVTLGHPIPDVRIVACDSEGNVLPAGATGELCIGGAGLARGYLGRPETTRARFLDAPDGEGRLYRTGDRGRVREDGAVEMVGRLDDQVKIRGMRVEPGEVATTLGDVPGVCDCAVVADEDGRGEKRLVAYVRMDDAPEGTRHLAGPGLRARLRERLADRLPVGLIPSVFVELAPLPLSPNGKLDHRALPSLATVGTARHVEPPRPGIETTVADLWARELGPMPLGRNENVFELGAHSLLVTHVHAALERATGHTIDIVLLFEHPTVAGLATAIADPQVPEDTRRQPAQTVQASARGADRRDALAARRRRTGGRT